MQTQLKHAAAFVRTSGVNTNARAVEAIVSDETIDSHGDVICQATWRLDRYSRNPIVLFGHDHMRPVGRAESVRVEGGALHARIVFASTSLGNELLQLYSEGALRAFSVGFRPGRIASEIINGRSVDRLLDCELIEVSSVSVPANPNALAVHKSLGLVPPSYASNAGAAFLDAVERSMRLTPEQHQQESLSSAMREAFGPRATTSGDELSASDAIVDAAMRRLQ